MTKQKSTFFLSAILGVCFLSFVATGCNDEKKSTTESTTSDTSSMMTTPAPTTDTMTMHGDTTGMDTSGTNRPIVPGN